MVQDQVLVNVTSAADAILGLMATYYVTSVPYPAHRYGTFLFIESELLYGKIKDDDAQLLQRLKDLFYT
ncbi:hypothetical protein FSP39_016134 [Pinctada imbricata]|uniref:Uncharacterized protein n=1 Tax=Pinctada imbricata TaxID=66713 RepID=A0AA89BXA7_PINIB|nr:hypothetical protein FSP39_016134 [Pinctada imbricata]